MVEASIKSDFGANWVICESQDVDLSAYSIDISGAIIQITNDGKVIAKSDCLTQLEYPIGKVWGIHRCYQGKLVDKLLDEDSTLFLNIERNFRPESSSLFNNYLKIDVPGENTSIITEFKQWKLFFPIKVKATCSNEVEADILVISLLLAWFRYEYNSHDQMY
jgi:hypothetical protein